MSSNGLHAGPSTVGTDHGSEVKDICLAHEDEPERAALQCVISAQCSGGEMRPAEDHQAMPLQSQLYEAMLLVGIAGMGNTLFVPS